MARVMQWKINDGQNQTKKLLNMRLGHVGIIVLKQQLEFNYFIDIINYSIKSRDFNLRVSYISRILNFLIFFKIANVAKFSTREIK